MRRLRVRELLSLIEPHLSDTVYLRFDYQQYVKAHGLEEADYRGNMHAFCKNKARWHRCSVLSSVKAVVQAMKENSLAQLNLNEEDDLREIDSVAGKRTVKAIEMCKLAAKKCA